MQCTVIVSKPNSEAIAVTNLQRQGFECYWPRFKVNRPNKPALIKPLFPRYLFVFFDKLWYSMRGTRGVSHVLLGNEGPLLVPSYVVAELRKREVDGFINLGKRVTEERFEKGQQVKTLEGPLAGVPLIYEGMSGPERVKVLAEILGRQTVIVVNEKTLMAASA